MSYWKDKNVLVTGASGFVGSYLVEDLLNEGSNVIGLIRRKSVKNLDNIQHLLSEERLKLVNGDLLDMYSLVSVLRDNDIDVVSHLAAQAFVPESFKNPIDTYQTNVLGTVNLLEAIRIVDRDIKMHFAGTSEEYGLVYPEECPIKETNPLRPRSPYAVSKVAGDLASEIHAKAYGIYVVRTRAFNHEGPKRGYQYVTTVIAQQVADILKGKANKIVLGNLEAERDWMDVRDAVRGYRLAIEKGKSGEVYNLGSGTPRSVKELTRMCLEMYNLKDIPIELDKSRLRPLEVPLLQCDYTKAKKELGWEPKIPLEKTMRDMVDWCYSRAG